MVAVRPLLVEELAEVLAFEFDTARGAVPRYRMDWRPNDQVQAVLSTCSSLIAIVDDHGSRVVQFSHFSVKEFLMSERLTSSLGDFSRYQINPEPAHTILAQACLGFLLHLNRHVDKESVKGFPLAEYAARHWVAHAQFEGVASRVKDGMESLFDCDKPHFATWVGIYNVDKESYWESPSKIPTPLYYSSLCGFSDLVEHLAIKHPKHVNAIGGLYEFPLLAALVGKHIRVAEILLKHGANVDIRGMGKQTPLHKEITDASIVQFLLNHGADVNCRRDDLRTPLHLVAWYGELEVARVLLEHKADVDSQDHKGKTPLHLLVEYGFRKDKVPDLAQLLLEHGADVNRRDEVNNNPLHLAMDRWMYKCARILLQHGADASVENSMGKTPLHLLFKNDYSKGDNILDLVRLSLEHGADVNIRTTNEWTLLHAAAFWGKPETTRVLLDHGANTNAENDRGETPLHLVSRGEYDSQADGVGIARLLLEHGVDVHAQDKDHDTALHSAAFWGRLEIARVLLERDANTNAVNDRGETPLHLVSRSKYDPRKDGVRIVRLLLGHSVDVHAQDKFHNIALHWAAFWGRLEIARVLLDHGANANAENDQGATPLHLVSRGKYRFQENGVGIAQLLLEHGVDVHAQDKDHDTALHSAAFWGRLEIARVLLNHGAIPDVENDQRETPLHLVSRGKYDFQENGVSIARLLLERGADMKAQDKDYVTPLHSARHRGRLDIAMVLLDYNVKAQAANH